MRYPATGNKIVIKINKEEQKKKVIISESGLLAPTTHLYMLYNLQYGEIISIGNGVKNPDIQIGRRAIIHHNVESNSDYLLDTLSNGDEIRILESSTYYYNTDMYGVIDENDNILPNPEFVFCLPEEQKKVIKEKLDFFGEQIEFNVQKVGNLYVSVDPNKKECKGYDLPTIAHVSPLDDNGLVIGKRIPIRENTGYPIQILGKEYLIAMIHYVNCMLD